MCEVRTKNLIIALIIVTISMMSWQINSLPYSGIAVVRATPTHYKVDVCHRHGTNNVIVSRENDGHLGVQCVGELWLQDRGREGECGSREGQFRSIPQPTKLTFI